MPHRGHVHADLVCAPGFQVDVQKTRAAECLDDAVVGHARAAVLGDGELPACRRMARNRRVDGALDRIRQPLHQRVVGLVHRALLEGALEHGVGGHARRHDHDAGGAHVQALHDALALRGSGVRQGKAHRLQPADHVRAFPAQRRMRCHAHWLVHGDHVRVLVQDFQALHQLGHWLRGALRLGKGDFQHRARGDAVGFLGGSSVDKHIALRRHLGGDGAGDSEELGDRRVHPHALKPLRHGQGPELTAHVRLPSSPPRACPG